MNLQELLEENKQLTTLLNDFRQSIQAREDELKEMEAELADDPQEAGSHLALQLAASQGIEPVKMVYDDDEKDLKAMTRDELITFLKTQHKKKVQ